MTCAPVQKRIGLDKVPAALARDDLRLADVTKPASSGRRPLCRANFNDADLLTLTFVKHAGQLCALPVEVVRRSRTATPCCVLRADADRRQTDKNLRDSTLGPWIDFATKSYELEGRSRDDDTDDTARSEA